MGVVFPDGAGGHDAADPSGAVAGPVGSRYGLRQGAHVMRRRGPVLEEVAERVLFIQGSDDRRAVMLMIGCLKEGEQIESLKVTWYGKCSMIVRDRKTRQVIAAYCRQRWASQYRRRLMIDADHPLRAHRRHDGGCDGTGPLSWRFLFIRRAVQGQVDDFHLFFGLGDMLVVQGEVV